MESLRVISFAPTDSRSISPHVVTMVSLSLKNPCCQKISSSGLRRMAPSVPSKLVFCRGRVSCVTARRARKNPKRHASSRSQWPRATSRTVRTVTSAAAGCRRTRAPVRGTRDRAGPSTTGRQRRRRRAYPRGDGQCANERFIHLFLLSSPHRFVFLGDPIPRLKTTDARPATSSASVQECGPGIVPVQPDARAPPSSAGTATDQPMTPVTPKPSQTPCAPSRRALILRAAFAPTCRRRSARSSAVGFRSSCHSCRKAREPAARNRLPSLPGPSGRSLPGHPE